MHMDFGIHWANSQETGLSKVRLAVFQVLHVRNMFPSTEKEFLQRFLYIFVSLEYQEKKR